MTRKEQLQRLHQKSPRTLIEAMVSLILFFAFVPLTLWTWQAGYWPLTIVLWLIQGHVGHANLLAFHEASHFVLHPRRWVNELYGVGMGSLIMTPISAYRYVHNQHHVHLGTQSDTELWPYVDCSTSRPLRWMLAFGELLLGFFVTPLVFVRGVLTAERLPPNVAKRLQWEYALVVLLWAGIITTVVAFNIETWFVLGYLIPSMIAGNLQSLRKFTEHMGLLGHDVPTTTRTVIDPSLFGRLLSDSMLHIDLHGPHHLQSKIPHFALRQATPLIYGEATQDPLHGNIYRSYLGAIGHMLLTLRNPRVGQQWQQTPAG